MVGANYPVEGDLEDLLEGTFFGRVLNSHAIVSIADVKGRITYVNDKFVEISGYSREELIGQNHRMLKSSEHDQDFYHYMWRTIANRGTWTGEIKNLNKNGDPYWVKATIAPRLNQFGKPFEYLSIRTDITEEKSAETLRAQQSTLDMVSREVYMFWADTLKFFYVNRRAQERLGLNQGELRQCTPLDLLEGATEAGFTGAVRPLMSGEKKALECEMELPSVDGTKFPGEVKLQLIEPEQGRNRFVAVIRDITLRKQAEIAKANFLGIMNHELRTPLTALKGALDLLQSEERQGTIDQDRRLLDLALKSSQKLETLINDLLTVQLKDAGQKISKIGKTDLAAVVAAAVEDLLEQSPQERKRVVFAPPQTPVPVRGDSDRLAQVVVNLLSNALKFSGDAEPVEVTLAQEGRYAKVAVKDYGMGVPEEMELKLFDRFFLADSSDRRRSGGTGLGLSISKAIVDEHDGTIEFESVPGKGSLFWFCLPLDTD
ncbi:PAS domain S-box protein [Aquicoccus sp. SU-CL01552]|uniref:PAS domain-containing sensor histidine kinase n=1 Tax=Aquicoccus sp. SU-CL01552 TaxID=3127656 RepID=UPI00310831C8